MSSNQYTYPQHSGPNRQKGSSNSPSSAQHGFPGPSGSHPQYTTAATGYAYPIAQGQATTYPTGPMLIQSLDGASGSSAYSSQQQAYSTYNPQMPMQYVAEHGYVVPSQAQGWEGYVEVPGIHDASAGSFHPGSLAPQPAHAVHPGWHASHLSSSRSATPQPYGNSSSSAAGYVPQAPVTIALTTPGGSTLTSSGNACHKCPATFQRMTDLKRHIRSVHTNETPYKCLGCDEGFVRSDARLRHWRESPACQQVHEQHRE